MAASQPCVVLSELTFQEDCHVFIPARHSTDLEGANPELHAMQGLVVGSKILAIKH